jgi:hypothetical protein
MSCGAAGGIGTATTGSRLPAPAVRRPRPADRVAGGMTEAMSLAVTAASRREAARATRQESGQREPPAWLRVQAGV